jgi:hypothetical protein
MGLLFFDQSASAAVAAIADKKVVRRRPSEKVEAEHCIIALPDRADDLWRPRASAGPCNSPPLLNGLTYRVLQGSCLGPRMKGFALSTLSKAITRVVDPHGRLA